MPHDIRNGSHSTSLAVECPACGEYSEMPLAWLKAAQTMDCATCGMTIDLAAGERRAEIDRLYAISQRSGA